MREAIASGLRTTFTYELELRTIVPGWFDRTIMTTVVAMSDQYDNLTRRHTLSRTIDGRIEDMTVTEDEAIVQTWLTKLNRVPVYDTSRLDATRDYYVRITSRARPFGGSLLGLTRTVTASAKFTIVRSHDINAELASDTLMLSSPKNADRMDSRLRFGLSAL